MGAFYGLKTHFKNSKDWTFLKFLETENTQILERILFKHKTTNTYLLADAYDGKYIKQTTIDFLNASSGSDEQKLKYENQELCFGGGADLLSYIGHDGLMEFSLDKNFESQNDERLDAIILACIAKITLNSTWKKPGLTL